MRLLTFRVHHEYKIFEIAKLHASSASARAGMDKRCPTVPNHWRLCNAPPKVLAYQLWRESPWQPARQADCHDRDVKPHCGSSNPHSGVAHSDGRGTRRGFLPRGLYDAHPLFVTGSPTARRCGWASYNP